MGVMGIKREEMHDNVIIPNQDNKCVGNIVPL